MLEQRPDARPAGDTCDAIIVAAGRGERLGLDAPKWRVPLRGEPMVLHSLRVLRDEARVARILVMVPPDESEMTLARAVLSQEFGNLDNARITVLAGGVERKDSVRMGLDWLEERDVPQFGIVLIHDAARPLVSRDLVRRCLDAMRYPLPGRGQAELPGLSPSASWGIGPSALVPGLPVRETLKLVFEGRIVLTQPRENLYAVQTPQLFRFGPLARAHRRAHRLGLPVTDDAALLEWQGIPVCLVEGETVNLKVTFPDDLLVAERLLAPPSPDTARRPTAPTSGVDR